MNTADLELIARSIVADGRGILAADETPGNLTKRFRAHRIDPTAEMRRAYRELLFTTPGIADYIGGVILHDETIRQRGSAGALVAVLEQRGIAPGIKVDLDTTSLAGCPGEVITEGLDGLADRLDAYREMGARFAKWRAVIVIDDERPTVRAVEANAHALARYAAVCQDRHMVPIVEPEVRLDGCFGIERAEQVTGDVLKAVFDALYAQHVTLEGMLLQPNMVVAGTACPAPTRPERVALVTLRCLRRHVPPAVSGIVFLSGEQDCVAATRHLNLINQLADVRPWTLSFSYGRALQDEALMTWRGRDENVPAAQRAFSHRARCAASAAAGVYSSAMEAASSAA